MITLAPRGSDNTGQLVDAIARAELTRQSIQLVSDTFGIQDEIQLTPKGAYHTLKMQGEAMGTPHPPCRRTFIDASAVDSGNVFNVQDARSVELSNFTLFGGSSRGRANGIVIDPVDTKAGSSDIDVNRVYLRGFSTGLLISPAMSDNADQVKLRNSLINECDIAYSVGQSQARANLISNTDISRCRVGIAGRAHGKRQGTPPKVYSTQFGMLDMLLDFPNSFGSPMLFDGIHLESCSSIGLWGPPATSKQPIIFRSSYLNIQRGISTPEYNPEINFISEGLVIVDGGSINSDGKTWQVFSADFRGVSIRGELLIKGRHRFDEFCYFY